MNSPNSRSPSNKSDEFFIGWLSLPPGYGRLLKPIAFAFLLLCGAAAGLVGFMQQSPGPAEWNMEEQVTFAGVAYATPYAMIRVADDSPGESVRTIFLVEAGKFGAVERVRPVDGQPVRVTGTLLHRDERWMLELLPGESGLQALPAMESESLQALRRLPGTPLGQVRVRGEIIDSKCYLGAMKPGGGKTHKACAALCLSGGIPPMFVTRTGGHEQFYLLTAEDGGPIEREVIDFVGEPVEIAGRLEQQGDLQVLKVAARNVQRR